MTRLPLVPYEEWDTEALSVLAPGRKLPPSNALGFLANHPPLAKAFLTFNGHLLGRTSSLPVRDRELAILRVAWRRRCAYEWAQHVLIARKAGVTDEEIAAVRAGDDTLINRAVDQLEEDSQLPDSTYSELAEIYDETQLMDFVFTVGAYGLLAVAFNTFGVGLDPGLPDGGFDSPA
ncbi:carboxymuconolactone decarboxylase family protein [Actinomadura craniellae]|uniref:Carboxymuconolactone decarboxylase family protein n=1 Tax=Actinomadura craniellae TaxID=2231787 RepID=A0A365HD56_9ACTN|nr:carboxymuconolactone decarboxylase family protein [Actinomadura craniellae]RAY17060.1 carboxymuconolactone decarboxylase family protein [Actinomadura craniellae]